MKRSAAFLGLALVGLALATEAEACRFCRVGPDADRFGVSDPMNAFNPDALIEQYRSDTVVPAPKTAELVTSTAALAEAAAAATPQPGSAQAPTASSYRARLLKVSNPVDATALGSAPAVAPAPPRTSDVSTPRVEPLSDWTAHLVDGSLLAGALGIGLFLRRQARRPVTS